MKEFNGSAPIKEPELNMTLARAARKREAKQKRADVLAKEKGIILKEINEDTIIFDADGYQHKTCPVANIMDEELMSILSDTLYCIDVGLAPNAGGAMDQTEVFRVAFTTLLHEKEIIKAELEKKHIEDAKKKSSRSGGRKRR